MNTTDITSTLETLYSELIDGAPTTGAYMLNRGDPGLLASLDKLSATDASKTNDGGASIAAHVDHLRYGLSLMNRWGAGEKDPWADADWTASWRRTVVSDKEWKQLRADLRDETHRWLKSLGTSRPMNDVELNIFVGNVAHVAYHLGAIRQIDRATRGPKEEEAQLRSR